MPKADYDSVGKPLIVNQDGSENLSSFTRDVPDGVIWRVRSIWVRFAATAMAGDRLLQISVEDPDDSDIFLRDASVIQPPNTSHDYQWAPGNPNDLAFTVGIVSGQPVLLQPWAVFPMSVSRISSGRAARIDVREANFVDPLDNMSVVMDVQEYDGPDPLP